MESTTLKHVYLASIVKGSRDLELYDIKTSGDTRVLLMTSCPSSVFLFLATVVGSSGLDEFDFSNSCNFSLHIGFGVLQLA